MDMEAFKKFLKRKRKKQNVIGNYIKTVMKFNDYLNKERNKELEEANTEDIRTYVKKIEGEKKSAKSSLYVLMNFFIFTENNELLQYTRLLREERTKKTRRIFPIKDFLDINQDYVKKLAEIGIKNVEDMLNAGKTKKQREQLAKQLNIPEEAILELVKLSDLTRLGYVKAKLTRLYYNSGLDSPIKIANFEPDELHAFFKKFIEESKWNGMIPNPKDLIVNVNSARKLEKIVED